MLAATVSDGTQEFDQRTLQDHVAPHTTSDLLYKNSLSDAAKTIFAGLIRVQPAAQHTDAYQKVRNLMLSDEAEANSMPGLEILADEVRCTHGATSGHVDAAEMFYLLSRGIRPGTHRAWLSQRSAPAVAGHPGHLQARRVARGQVRADETPLARQGSVEVLTV